MYVVNQIKSKFGLMHKISTILIRPVQFSLIKLGLEKLSQFIYLSTVLKYNFLRDLYFT